MFSFFNADFVPTQCMRITLLQGETTSSGPLGGKGWDKRKENGSTENCINWMVDLRKLALALVATRVGEAGGTVAYRIEV